MVKYGKMVNELFSGANKNMDSEFLSVIHAVLGIVTEAGELADAIKKVVGYSDKLNMGNVIEEMGDIEFYLEALRQHFSITREEILLENMSKLSKRYTAGKFSSQHALDRADKA